MCDIIMQSLQEAHGKNANRAGHVGNTGNQGNHSNHCNQGKHNYHNHDNHSLIRVVVGGLLFTVFTHWTSVNTTIPCTLLGYVCLLTRLVDS
jgi:hypothetical protein